MFSLIDANDLACALVLLGCDAWSQPQGDFGHGVWCEDAGLLFATRAELDCWLGRYLTVRGGQLGAKNG
jgi:hypothetical protein